MTKQEALTKIESLIEEKDKKIGNINIAVNDEVIRRLKKLIAKNKINKEWDKQKYEQAVYEIDTAEIEKKVLKHHGITYE